MSEYKLDMSKYTIDEQPRMWTDAEYREAFQSLYFEYHKIKSERDQYKTERDTLIDDLTWYKAKVDRLEHENKRLTGRTRKLTTHRTMWDNLKDWRRDMLEIDKNDTQIISLGLVMDDLEKRHLYKGDKQND
ncbi:hypothetical protein RPO70_03865 [Staphylococcus arlettae]|uniref:hypothetical protein n=1 Tax=Staphylococcus arlettae TaxID=29378 RepID=UPI0028A3BE9F|nr:hypothetical protein [Staphylococcus arlettae]MDT4050324.1 hypothetical protein [Staphylococcus arlettae]